MGDGAAAISAVGITVDSAFCFAVVAGIVLAGLAGEGDVVASAHDLHLGEGKGAVARKFDADEASARALTPIESLRDGGRQFAEHRADPVEGTVAHGFG